LDVLDISYGRKIDHLDFNGKTDWDDYVDVFSAWADTGVYAHYVFKMFDLQHSGTISFEVRLTLT